MSRETDHTASAIAADQIATGKDGPGPGPSPCQAADNDLPGLLPEPGDLDPGAAGNPGKPTDPLEQYRQHLVIEKHVAAGVPVRAPVLPEAEDRPVVSPAIGKDNVPLVPLGDKRQNLIDQAALLPDAQAFVIKSDGPRLIGKGDVLLQDQCGQPEAAQEVGQGQPDRPRTDDNHIEMFPVGGACHCSGSSSPGGSSATGLLNCR